MVTYLIIDDMITKESFCRPGSEVTDCYMGMIVDSQCKDHIGKTGVHPACLRVVESCFVVRCKLPVYVYAHAAASSAFGRVFSMRQHC